MIITAKSSIYLLTVVLIAVLISCDQPNKKTNDSILGNDSMSVKKMGTDSNAKMPVHVPKDSTEKIPNLYDSSRKPL